MSSLTKQDYITQETVTGVVPMLKKDKQYNFWDLFLSTSGFAIATWCYTQGAYGAQFLSLKQLLINIFAVNIIFLTIECIPVFFAVRYGIDLWVWLRSVLGKKGVAIFATVISLANFGWYAVDAQLFSSSMINLIKNLGVEMSAGLEGFLTPALGVLCVLLGTLIALGGPTVIKWTSRFLVSALLVVGVVVVVLCFTSVPISDMLAIKGGDLAKAAGTDIPESPMVRFMLSAEGNAAFAFSWSTQALVMPRLCSTESKGYWGTQIAYAFVAPFFVAAGGIMSYAYFTKFSVYCEDPTTMLAGLCAPVVALLSLLMVAFANIGTQGMGSYVNCMIVKSGMPKISYKLMVWIAFVYVSILTVWGWPMEHFGSFISCAAFLQGPIIGMVVVDYLFTKKRKISLKSAFYLKGHDAYKFTGGFNLIGLGIMIISFVAALLFVYNPVDGTIGGIIFGDACAAGANNIFYYITGSGFTLVLGALLYFLCSIFPPTRKYMLKDRNDLEIV